MTNFFRASEYRNCGKCVVMLSLEKSDLIAVMYTIHSQNFTSRGGGSTYIGCWSMWINAGNKNASVLPVPV
jgi:hypothetical protein